jgi:hypothetical protein
VPKRTIAPRTKLTPVIVTTVLPLEGPSRGETEVTFGAAENFDGLTKPE